MATSVPPSDIAERRFPPIGIQRRGEDLFDGRESERGASGVGQEEGRVQKRAGAEGGAEAEAAGGGRGLGLCKEGGGEEGE